MNLRLLNARQTRYAAYAAIYTLVVLAAVVAANVLADRYNKSYDGTSNQRYSLSDQTVKIVKGLQQDATVTYYDQTSRFDAGKDLLDRYANLSSKVHLKYVDPDKQPQLAREAGIRNYGTAIVQIASRTEEARNLTEEGITGAMIRGLKDTTRTVCFVTGSGEHRIDDNERNGYSRLNQVLGQDQYTARTVSLLEKAEVPADCTVLVVAGPSSNYQQPQVEAIRKLVEGGGRALIMLDPPIKFGRSQVADNDALLQLLQSWGVTMNRDLILDLNPVGQMVGLGPQVALVSTYDSHAIVNEMKGTATGFPLSRSLEIKNTDKTAVEKLFSSSGTSLATTKLNSPEVNPQDPQNKKGSMPLAAAGTYNTGKESSQGRFVVIGTSAWAANSFLNFNGNSDLALNTMNWLSSDEDLISIRPKEQEDRRVNMTRTQLAWVRAISQFVLPLAVVLAGAAVWWRRR